MYTIKRFEDKIAAVTGGAKGIGKGCCLRFAAEGARVAVLDLAMNEAAEVAAECERLSGQPALALSCNVADPASVDAAFAAITEAWGGLHILVASAGIYTGQPLTEVPLKDWQRTIDIDLTGVFLCNQAVAATLMKQGGGSIINISSMAGKTSWPGSAQYSAAKSGVIGLTRSVAMELAPYKVNVERGLPRQHPDRDGARRGEGSGRPRWPLGGGMDRPAVAGLPAEALRHRGRNRGRRRVPGLAGRGLHQRPGDRGGWRDGDVVTVKT